jgi:hypothetical protein
MVRDVTLGLRDGYSGRTLPYFHRSIRRFYDNMKFLLERIFMKHFNLQVCQRTRLQRPSVVNKLYQRDVN